MASLYERLLGTHATRPKIPVHQFQAAAAEWARGRITGVQANAIILSASGMALDATEQLEAQDLVATVTGLVAVDRPPRMLEIDHVLLLADSRLPPYDTGAALRTRLGVQTR